MGGKLSEEELQRLFEEAGSDVVAAIAIYLNDRGGDGGGGGGGAHDDDEGAAPMAVDGPAWPPMEEEPGSSQGAGDQGVGDDAPVDVVVLDAVAVQGGPGSSQGEGGDQVVGGGAPGPGAAAVLTEHAARNHRPPKLRRLGARGKAAALDEDDLPLAAYARDRGLLHDAAAVEPSVAGQRRPLAETAEAAGRGDAVFVSGSTLQRPFDDEGAEAPHALGEGSLAGPTLLGDGVAPGGGESVASRAGVAASAAPAAGDPSHAGLLAYDVHPAGAGDDAERGWAR